MAGERQTPLSFCLSPGCPHWISLHLKHAPCFLTEISGNGVWNTDFPSLSSNICQDQYTLPCQRVSICTGRTINGGVRGEKKERIIF